MSRPWRLARAVAAIVLGLTASAQQQFPALEKGFQPEKLYQFGGVDSVNVFSGTLLINLPIGPDYALDGGLTYGLRLSYNSKPWDFSQVENHYVRAFPSNRSLAGMGWVLGMGRFFPTLDPLNNSFSDVYEAPDGGDHRFDRVLPDVPCTASCATTYPRYTSDGTNLRLRNPSATVREIDFPDGMIKKFVQNGADRWELREIRNARSSEVVSITPGTGTTTGCSGDTDSYWVINDTRGRNHLVCFTNLEMDDVDRPMVDRVLLSRQGRQLTYQFDYAAETLPKPNEDTDPRTEVWRQNHDVHLLQTLTLPDGSEYQFTQGNGDVFGAMTLPTLGKISYQYESWYVPSTNICDDSYYPGIGLGGFAHGVSQRTFTPAVPPGQTPVSHTWHYARQLRPGSGSSGYTSSRLCNIQIVIDPDIIPAPVPMHVQLYDELVVTITDPLGHKVASHFSVWPGDDTGRMPDPDTSPAGFKRAHHGYPYGRYDAAQNRYLSQEMFDCTGTCALKRSIWVRQDPAWPAVEFSPHRIVSQSTVFHDDPAGCVAEGAQANCGISFSNSSDWDGYGHYRQTSSNVRFDDKTDLRTVTTAWNKVAGVPRTFTASNPWVLNTYESSTTTEGGVSSPEQACFDLATGILKGSRKLAGTTPAGKDLAVLYESANGNISAEKYYGGDTTPLASNASTLCTALSAIAATTPAYRVNHQWQNAQLAKSQHVGMTFFSRDLTVDLDGLVTSSRDTSGLQTNYLYDANWRLSSVSPPGQAQTTYTYTNASGTATSLSPANVVESTQSSNVDLRSEYQFDSFGRLWRQKELMPNGQWSLRETLFDQLDRTSSASEPASLLGETNELSFSPPHRTTYLYDIFGRVTLATAPDQSVSRIAYVGSRQTRRYVSGPAVAEKLRSTEIYDGLGRLTSVIERPDTAGDVVTSYGYDVGGRLRTVQMKSPTGPIQDRIFDYDGRGLLRWESQPESGMTAYTYDARGHVLSKDKSAARSQFDLRYTYDAGERLTEVKGRNPFHDADPAGQTEFRIIKSFQYATANLSGDYRKGKLEFAGRYNYDAFDVDVPAYLIQDLYGYQDAAGRRTVRTTSIHRLDAYGTELMEVGMGMTYDDVGRPSVIHYPMCLDCGGPSVDPQRSSMDRWYAHGRLVSIPGYVSSLSYWPNGMRNVLSHSNGVADTQVIGVMPRPSQITFGPYERCVAPTILTHPTGSSVPAGGGSTTLSVTLDSLGTQPFGYEWWNVSDDEPAGSTQSVVVTLPSGSPSKTYRVTVSNACGFIRSQSAKVTVGACSAPTTGTLTPALQPDRSFILRANAEGRVGRTFKWKRLSDGVEWTTETLAVPAPSADITYSFTVTDDCGNATSSITLKPAMVITSTALQATAVTTTQISVQWPAVSGATTYSVERRSGAQWGLLGTTSTTTYLDNTVIPSKTYAYRVSASGGGRQSGYSNSDVATTRSFTQAVQYTNVTAAVINQMLEAVNSVRGAAGWPAVGWSNILAASDPVPNPGNFVMKRHVTSSRSRMNEVLQSLGVPVPVYPDPDLAAVPIRAEHINSILARAQ